MYQTLKSFDRVQGISSGNLRVLYLHYSISDKFVAVAQQSTSRSNFATLSKESAYTYKHVSFGSSYTYVYKVYLKVGPGTLARVPIGTVAYPHIIETK